MAGQERPQRSDSKAWISEMPAPQAQGVGERAPDPRPAPRPQQEPAEQISGRKEGRAPRVRGRGQQEEEPDHAGKLVHSWERVPSATGMAWAD